MWKGISRYKYSVIILESLNCKLYRALYSKNYAKKDILGTGPLLDICFNTIGQQYYKPYNSPNDYAIDFAYHTIGSMQNVIFFELMLRKLHIFDCQAQFLQCSI